MNKKPTKSTRPPKKHPRSRKPEDVNHWHAFLDPDSHRFYPGSDEIRKRLIYTLLEWAKDPENIETGQFLAQHYIPHRTMYDWIDKYPDVKQAWKDARMMIASHRRVGSMKRKLDPKSCYRDLYRYDPSENEVDERQLRLHKNIDEDKGAVTINVYDKTPEVTTREDMLQEQKDRE